MTFSGSLYSYQEVDTDYMLERGNLLLAYGQGSGKTVITISALEKGMDTGVIPEPGLIICLSSLKDQWAQAIHQWTGGHQELNKRTGLLEWTGGSSTPLVISGTPDQRRAQYEQALGWEQEGGADYIILSYEQVVNDWKQVKKLPRGFMVLDEATMVKNPRSKRSRAVKRLGASCRLRYALTGTPIENGKPEEMFSIMQFVDDEVLGRWDVFDKAFIVRDGWGKVTRYRNIPIFNESMAPAMRRRTRHDPDVAPFFPDVVEEKAPLVARLDPVTARAYRHIASELVVDLREAVATMGTFDLGSLYGYGDGMGDGLQGRISQKRMALQMLVDHPHLLQVSAEKFHAMMEGKGSGGSAYIADLFAQGVLDKVTRTPKMDTAMRYIDEAVLSTPENKLVIFCTYVDNLRLFQERFKVGSVIFTGSMTDRQKKQAMGEFKQDPDTRVFISSDAGGYGIDLPEANYLLNYSFPDKWGTSDQRETRIIRASTQWDSVYVRRILVEGSIDVLKYNGLVMKGKVSQAFLEGKGLDSRGRLINDAAGLLAFLTTGAGDLTVG